MVDVSGHPGMALLWLAGAWLVFDDPRAAATVVAVGAPFGLLPDVDLHLQLVLPTVKHHGAFHTVPAVVVMAAAAAPVVGWVLDRGSGDWLPPELDGRTRRVGFLAVLVAGVSHVFADVLSAPDISEASSRSGRCTISRLSSTWCGTTTRW